MPRVEGDVFVCAAEKLLLSPSLHIYIYLLLLLHIMISVSCTTTRALVVALDKKIPIHECHHQLSHLKRIQKNSVILHIYILAQKYKTNIETINNRIYNIIIHY